eukprot:6392006-Pyramimonas_sp.AAC.1
MYDILFIAETWRQDREEVVETSSGDSLFLSGGSSHHGVGIAVSPKFRKRISNIQFHAFSPRCCALDFSIAGKVVRAIAVYFPTSWSDDAEADALYDLLSILLEGDGGADALTIIGGDFNAHVGALVAGDDQSLLGAAGSGVRNDRG